MSKFKTIEDQREYINSSATQSKLGQLLIDQDFAQQPDDDNLNPWSKNQDALKGNISRVDAMGLQLTTLMYNGAFSKENPPSKEAKELMQKFFENAIGNKNLNSFLSQDAVKSQISYIDYVTKSTAVTNVAYFSFKTRNLGQMEHVLDKLGKVHEAALSGNPVSDKDKISLKEFAVASDLAKTLPMLEKLNASGFIEGSEKLEKMYANSKKAQEIVSYLEQESAKDLQKVGPGVLILDNTNKKSNIMGKSLGFFDKVATLFSSHGHSSMLHFNQAGTKAQRSHINPKLLKDDFDINRQLYSNMYVVDPIALIPKEKHQLLEQVYGKNWKSEVVNKFKTIDNEIHTNTSEKFGSLSASGEKEQYMTGLANIIPFGHKKLKANDFNELHSKVMTGEYAKQENPKMLCSEFCATTIAVSLVELDKQIKEDISKNKSAKITGIDLEKPIVTIPFGKHENLHKMHPDRLLKALKNHHCVQPVTTKAANYIKEAAVKIGKPTKKHILKTSTSISPPSKPKQKNHKEPGSPPSRV